MAHDKEILDARLVAIAECRKFLADMFALALAAERKEREDAEGESGTCEAGDESGHRD